MFIWKLHFFSHQHQHISAMRIAHHILKTRSVLWWASCDDKSRSDKFSPLENIFSNQINDPTPQSTKTRPSLESLLWRLSIGLPSTINSSLTALHIKRRIHEKSTNSIQRSYFIDDSDHDHDHDMTWGMMTHHSMIQHIMITLHRTSFRNSLISHSASRQRRIHKKYPRFCLTVYYEK